MQRPYPDPGELRIPVVPVGEDPKPFRRVDGRVVPGFDVHRQARFGQGDPPLNSLDVALDRGDVGVDTIQLPRPGGGQVRVLASDEVPLPRLRFADLPVKAPLSGDTSVGRVAHPAKGLPELGGPLAVQDGGGSPV